MANDLATSDPEAASLLAFTSSELEIADAARTMLADLIPITRLHRPGGADLDPDLRRQLAELGWFGLIVPEAAGGSGLDAVQHALFFREVGRLCGPLDILAQSLAALATADDEALCGAFIAGERGAALAVVEGETLRVLGSPAADEALMADEAGAALIPLAGLALEARPPLDEGVTLRLGRRADARPRPVGDVWRMAELGAAAMLVGGAEATLDLIVEYAKVRETFGRKIGAYQAVRHPCADMALRIEAARSQLWYAAAALKGGRGDAQAHLDAAKHLANVAAVVNADVNIQLHGGIGITDEHDSHLFLKRALLLSQLYGGKRALLARLLHAELED